MNDFLIKSVIDLFFQHGYVLSGKGTDYLAFTNGIENIEIGLKGIVNLDQTKNKELIK